MSRDHKVLMVSGEIEHEWLVDDAGPMCVRACKGVVEEGMEEEASLTVDSASCARVRC